MTIQSLDPRISRLNLADNEVDMPAKQALDQFETYQVFMQIKEGKPYGHVGIVHAPNEAMALLFAKEQFSRRFTCTGMWTVKTENVKITAYTEADGNIYDQIPASGFSDTNGAESSRYEIFHLKRRGKQHAHAGSVKAASYDGAINQAKMLYNEGKVMNAWIVKTSDISFVDEEDKDIWSTLSEKQHRDIMTYKANDKIKQFKEKNI